MAEDLSPLIIQCSEGEFDSVSDAFEKVVSKFEEDWTTAVQAISRELWQVIRNVATEMRARHSKPWEWTGPTSPFPDLQVRSGTGLQSILDSQRFEGDPEEGNVEASISTAQMYAIHETGGTISAKRTRYLTIPLQAALDSRGLPIRPSARDWPNTFVQKSRAGNLIIFQRVGKGKVVPLYLLKETVKIPPRLGMGDAFDREVGFFEERALDAFARTFGDA